MVTGEIKCTVCTLPMTGVLNPAILMPCRCMVHEHCMKIFQQCAHAEKSKLNICRVVVTALEKDSKKSSSSSFAEGYASTPPSMIETEQEGPPSNFMQRLSEQVNGVLNSLFADRPSVQITTFEMVVNTISNLLQYAKNQTPPMERVIFRCLRDVDNSFIEAVKQQLEQCQCEVTETIETEMFEKMNYSSADTFDNAEQGEQTSKTKYRGLDVLNGKSHVIVIFTNRPI